MTRNLLRATDLFTLAVLSAVALALARWVTPSFAALVWTGSIGLIGAWEFRRRRRQARQVQEVDLALRQQLEHARRLEALKAPKG